MSRLTQKGQGAPFNLFTTVSEALASASQPFSNSSTIAGERFDAADGREFVIVQNGTVALTPGVLVQAPPVVANHQNLDVTAVSTNQYGQTTVTATLGATAVTVNQYQGGYVVVNDNNGEGQTLKIASNPAADASASIVITLTDTPVTALTAASEICLLPNLYVGVVINPTTPTNTPVGVTLYAIAASTANTTNVFGFIQTKGITACLNADAALTVGSAISPSNATAGGVENGVIAQGFVGRALQTGVDTEYRAVYIDL